ncbi:unnamed protein product (mitochondrion) [Plasmodiophora brassicae]|uniref:Mediator of DNA damage checkpoint protein 1 n=1 Tax=Plasmodiophora brassicae TaxID=37360 RepID=A0A3P3Y0K3_PLABS|nr:unnamed protein product [Plasmodiophora brassicae]
MVWPGNNGIREAIRCRGCVPLPRQRRSLRCCRAWREADCATQLQPGHQAMSLRLSRVGAENVVCLAPGEHVVGRDARASVVVDSRRVSHRHAVIDHNPDSDFVFVMDVGSVNGVRLQSLSSAVPSEQPRIRPNVWYAVPPGSVVTFGDAAFTLTKSEQSGSPPKVDFCPEQFSDTRTLAMDEEPADDAVTSVDKDDIASRSSSEAYLVPGSPQPDLSPALDGAQSPVLGGTASVLGVEPPAAKNGTNDMDVDQGPSTAVGHSSRGPSPPGSPEMHPSEAEPVSLLTSSETHPAGESVILPHRTNRVTATPSQSKSGTVVRKRRRAANSRTSAFQQVDSDEHDESASAKPTNVAERTLPASPDVQEDSKQRRDNPEEDDGKVSSEVPIVSRPEENPETVPATIGTASDVDGTSPEPPVAEEPSAKPERDSPVIMFTGIATEDLQQMVQVLGGVLTEEPGAATVLVCDHVRRTVKFLCAISTAKHIVNEQWLLDSAAQKHFLECAPYCVRDKPAEKNFKFNLEVTLARPHRDKLLSGKRFWVVKGCKPSPSDFKPIIGCAGGTVVEGKSPPLPSPDLFVISSTELDKENEKLATKGHTLYDKELVLTSILRQNFEAHDEYKISVPSPRKKARR